MPKVVHRFGVVFSHFVQLVMPFSLFAPQPPAAAGRALPPALERLMCFRPFSVRVALEGPLAPGYEILFLRLLQRLLAADRATLELLGRNPWAERPPRFVRAVYYRYRFADRQERKTGAFWQRTRVGEYLPAVEASSLVER